MVPMVGLRAARRLTDAVGQHDLHRRRADRVDAPGRGRRGAAATIPRATLATLTLLVGAILLVARVLQLGVLIDNISAATLTGVKVGVGLTVAAGQLPKLLGIAGDPDATSFFAEVRGVIEDLDDISWATVALLGGAPSPSCSWCRA